MKERPHSSLSSSDDKDKENKSNREIFSNYANNYNKTWDIDKSSSLITELEQGSITQEQVRILKDNEGRTFPHACIYNRKDDGTYNMVLLKNMLLLGVSFDSVLKTNKTVTDEYYSNNWEGVTMRERGPYIYNIISLFCEMGVNPFIGKPFFVSITTNDNELTKQIKLHVLTIVNTIFSTNYTTTLLDKQHSPNFNAIKLTYRYILDYYNEHTNYMRSTLQKNNNFNIKTLENSILPLTILVKQDTKKIYEYINNKIMDINFYTKTLLNIEPFSNINYTLYNTTENFNNIANVCTENIFNVDDLLNNERKHLLEKHNGLLPELNNTIITGYLGPIETPRTHSQSDITKHKKQHVIL